MLEEQGKMTAPLHTVQLTGNGSTSSSRYLVALPYGAQPIARQCSTERRGSVWIPSAGFDVAMTVLAPANDACVSDAASAEI